MDAERVMSAIWSLGVLDYSLTVAGGPWVKYRALSRPPGAGMGVCPVESPCQLDCLQSVTVRLKIGLFRRYILMEFG